MGVAAIGLPMLAADAWAVQRIAVFDERTTHAPVSREQLTVLVFPATVVQAVTSASGLEIKTSDRHVIVAPTDRPTDLVVTTTQYVYVLMLDPEAKPADTVVIEDARVAAEPAGRGSDGRAATHQDIIIDLLRAAMSGRWPKGTTPRLMPGGSTPTWVDLETEQALSATVRRGGGLYELRRYVLANRNGKPRSFREQEFYTGEEFGIALSRQVVEPGQTVVLCVVMPGSEAPPDEAAPSSGKEPGK